MKKTLQLRLSQLGALLSTCLLIIAMVQLANHAVAQTTCTTCTNPPQLGQQNTWPQNSLVTVNLSPSFSADEVRYIQQAFTNWQNSGTNSGVVFQFTQGSQPISGSNTVQIWKETPAPEPDGSQPQAAVTSYYNAGNTNLDHTVMEIDPRVTNLTALQMAVAHEVGHMFGLDDCDTCCNGTSVMTGYDNFNDIHSGMVSPSSCDVNTANQAGQYNPNTVRPPSIGSGGDTNGGSGGSYGNLNRDYYSGGYCTTYWRVWYVSWDGGVTWEESGQVDYVGCW